jgi:hypothetical protein
MSVGEKELGASALDERVNGGGDREPRVDPDEQWSEETDSGSVGTRGRAYRLAILTLSGAMLAFTVAWTAFLVYVAAWIVGAIS